LAHPGETPDVDLQAAMQIDLGEILIRLGMTKLAHRAFERASAATTEPTLVRLAETSFRFNLWQEAQAVLRRNVELHPQSAVAHWNLAHSYAESWQLEDAMAELAAAEAIAPQLGAKSMRASVAGRIGDVDTAMRLYTELAEDEGPRSKMRSSAPVLRRPWVACWCSWPSSAPPQKRCSKAAVSARVRRIASPLEKIAVHDASEMASSSGRGHPQRNQPAIVISARA
jgi:tetratricopeptide (TPR) repeat protein